MVEKIIKILDQIGGPVSLQSYMPGCDGLNNKALSKVRERRMDISSFDDLDMSSLDVYCFVLTTYQYLKISVWTMGKEEFEICTGLSFYEDGISPLLCIKQLLIDC